VISAKEALKRLKEGNRRFVAGQRSPATDLSLARRAELAKGQAPFAIILGCSDSRVPAELVFDQGLGDLFVIRVAGNIAARSQIGSVEFAAAKFGTQLVVVLGHTQCGAVSATLEELGRPAENLSPNLKAIVDSVRPAVEGLLKDRSPKNPGDIMARAIRANIQASADHLRRDSKIIERLIREDGLLVVGAEYSLETGAVEFLDAALRSSRG
jgi:carbonic anhydrase